MASLYPKKVSGKTYWYLREMGRVDGKPKMISERYLGTAADIAAAMETREAAALPERTRHLAFGDVAAAWGILEDLGVAAVIDEVTGSRPAGAALSAGTYLALAALNRLVAPCSKAAFADWWKTTAGDRLAKIGAPALDHRYFWDAMHAVTLEQLEEISRTIAVRIVGLSGVDVLVGRAGHDQFRHVHRDRERQGAGRAAGQGQAETLRPAAGRAGPGRDPGRRHPADLARLPRRPARRHPVPGDDRSAAGPVPGGLRRGRGQRRRRGHDRGLRRRAELRGQLHPPGSDRHALHRVGPGLGLPGPDRTARLPAIDRGRGPVRRPDRP